MKQRSIGILIKQAKQLVRAENFYRKAGWEQNASKNGELRFEFEAKNCLAKKNAK